MIYELRIDCFSENVADLCDVLDKLNDHKSHFTVIHPNEPDQQCSVIDLIECHHDETPPQPCHEIEHWDNCPVTP